MSKYIIEVDDNEVDGLFKAKGFNTLVFDQNGLDRLQKYEEKETADSTKFPKVGDAYFSILVNGEIIRLTWYGDIIDNKRLALGNVFKTEESAEFERERRNVLAAIEKFAEPLDAKWYGNACHYFIYYSYRDKCLKVDGHTMIRSGERYFESEEKAMECIKAVGEDRIKEFYIGVQR